MNTLYGFFIKVNKEIEKASAENPIDTAKIRHEANERGLSLYVTERLLVAAYNRKSKKPSNKKGRTSKTQITKNSIEILGIGEVLPKSSEFLIDVEIEEKGRKAFTKSHKFNLNDYPSENEFVEDFSKRIGNIELSIQETLRLRESFSQNRNGFKKREKRKKQILYSSIVAGVIALIFLLIGTGVFKNTEERAFDRWKSAQQEKIECIQMKLANIDESLILENIEKKLNIASISLTGKTFPLDDEDRKYFDAKIDNIKQKLMSQYQIDISSCK